MKYIFYWATLSAGLLLSNGATAAEAVSEPETHLARGIADKTNLLLAVNDLAAEKSSNPDIKMFAAQMAEQYAAALTAFAKRAEAAGISNVAPPRGAQPAGGPPVPMPPEATQANGMGGNGMNANGAGGPGGNGGNPKEKVINTAKERIAQFKGTQFDEVYLLTVLQVTENIERQVMAEFMTPTSNKALLEACKIYIQDFAKNAIVIQEMLTRAGVDKIAVQPGKTDAEARARLSIGDLFGLN